MATITRGRDRRNQPKEEDVPMAEMEKPQDPQGPTSAETPEKVPTLEEALASLGAPQVVASGHDHRAKFITWLKDFMKKNPDAMKTEEEIAAEKKAKEETAETGK